MQINDQGGFRLAQNHLIYATGFYREAVYQVNRVSQAVYEHRLSRARDPQFELVDALLLSSMIYDSSLSPVGFLSGLSSSVDECL